MTECKLQGSTEIPAFSIVIPVYNDWVPLEQCLQSVAVQTNAPQFEVIIVDDGSEETAPQSIRNLSRPFELTIIRQLHKGIAVARNQGIRASKGEVLLFVDADCRLQAGCLTALNSSVSRSPQYDSFQLRLVGNRSSLVGRAEDLRLSTFQEYMLQPDGSIRYLNTAGFAIRRTSVDPAAGLFEPAALRAEDTLLLAGLMHRGQLPLFVTDAIVEHAIPLSLMQCVRKDLRSVSLEGKAYEIIASKGVRIRITFQERLKLLRSMWKAAGQSSIGRSAWFVLVIRQTTQRAISLAYQWLGISPARSI